MGLREKKSEVQRKPSGCAIIQIPFPPVQKTSREQGRTGNHADKGAKNGVKKYVVGSNFPLCNNEIATWCISAARNDIHN